MSGCLILNVNEVGGIARRAFAGMQASTDSGVAAPFVQAHDAKIRSWLSEGLLHTIAHRPPHLRECVPMAPFVPRHPRTCSWERGAKMPDYSAGGVVLSTVSIELLTQLIWG